MLLRETLALRLPVHETSSLRLAESIVQTPETTRRLRRLKLLQDQFQRANRRAAGPFSHPFATRGALSKLREQIRDVSRVADAVLLNAESANDLRMNELCNDLKNLLQTQQRWTDRLENQIWRLESQVSLMNRLHHLLQDRSPCNDRLWELCEMIARETQTLPTGLLLLPEPGHRIVLPNSVVSPLASWSLEQARLAVFSAITLLPDVPGADIVAQTLQASSAALLESAERDYDASVFAEPRWMQRAAISQPTEEVSRLINIAGAVLTGTETFSLNASEMLAPPAFEEFYGGLSVVIDASLVEDGDIAMARAICRSLGLAATDSEISAVSPAVPDDAAIVFTHKLRWHSGATSDTAGIRPATRSRTKRPHFGATASPAMSLTLYAREE
jgi:hypothetical protein